MQVVRGRNIITQLHRLWRESWDPVHNGHVFYVGKKEICYGRKDCGLIN